MLKQVLRLSDIVLPAYKEFWHTDKTYVICKGSRGSGKSKQAALWHIWNMKKNPLANTLVVRKVFRTIKDSCYADLCWAITQLHMDDEWKCTVSPLEITHKKTGQKILFRGLDDGIKVTSVSVPHGVLNYLWIEEFYEIMNEADFDILDESIRGELPDGYHKRVTCTFNPWAEGHFSKKRFFDTESDNVLAMTTTYMDNPRLSQTDIELFEDMKKRSPRRYRVAGLGEWGVSEGLVYEKWKEQSFDFDALRKKPGIKSVFGLDFGYSVDPSAMVIGLIDPGEKMLYIWDEMYKPGMSNEAIAGWIQEHGYGKEKIVADSAEPKSIDRLKDLGVRRVKAAKKGPDSIRAGIDFLQDFEMVIHPRCCNFLTEISQYAWAKDKFGKLKGTPVDEYNHLMDALRYGCEEYMIKGGLSVLKPRGK